MLIALNCAAPISDMTQLSSAARLNSRSRRFKDGETLRQALKFDSSADSSQNLTGAQLAAQLSSSALLGCSIAPPDRKANRARNTLVLPLVNTSVLQSVNTFVLQSWQNLTKIKLYRGTVKAKTRKRR